MEEPRISSWQSQLIVLIIVGGIWMFSIWRFIRYFIILSSDMTWPPHSGCSPSGSYPSRVSLSRRLGLWLQPLITPVLRLVHHTYVVNALYLRQCSSFISLFKLFMQTDIILTTIKNSKKSKNY